MKPIPGDMKYLSETEFLIMLLISVTSVLFILYVKNAWSKIVFFAVGYIFERNLGKSEYMHGLSWAVLKGVRNWCVGTRTNVPNTISSMFEWSLVTRNFSVISLANRHDVTLRKYIILFIYDHVILWMYPMDEGINGSDDWATDIVLASSGRVFVHVHQLEYWPRAWRGGNVEYFTEYFMFIIGKYMTYALLCSFVCDMCKPLYVFDMEATQPNNRRTNCVKTPGSRLYDHSTPQFNRDIQVS